MTRTRLDRFRRPLRLRLAAVLGAVAVAAAGPARADPKDPTVGLGGYDPVAYVADAEAVRGYPEIAVERDGMTYRFADVSARDRFLADPDRFMPAYAGYCAVAMANGRLAAGDPEMGFVLDGRLYLMKDAQAYAVFVADPHAILNRAEAAWPDLRAETAAEEATN